MKISVFGLGYVGCISLGCLAESGHDVIGVDVSEAKVRLIGEGKPTILENRIEEIISRQHLSGRIQATTDHLRGIAETDISILCVGTPPSPQGHLNLDQILHVARQIAEGLKEKNSFHTIVIRSTVPPGTNSQVTELVGEVSGKTAGHDFAVVSNPEFLREGSAVEDYYNPPFTLIGTLHDKALPIIDELYRETGLPVTRVDVATAEMIKYVNNTFHALKVAFANEVGNICKKLGVDSHALMDIFCRDRRLNISPTYLKPGFAYGGACLPKDLKALSTMAHDLYLEAPVINAISRSNDYHKSVALELILSHQPHNIGILGLSFKPGTDDLRNSPTVELIEHLLGKGFQVKVYDRHVVLSRLMGANKAFIQKHLPHISEIISDDLDQVAKDADLLVITHGNPEYSDLSSRFPDKRIIDLARVDELRKMSGYEGIGW